MSNFFYAIEDLKAVLINQSVVAGVYLSPYGRTWIHATSDYLLGVYFCDQSCEQHINDCFAQKYALKSFIQDQRVVDHWGYKIFQIKNQTIFFKLGGSLFQRNVWQQLSTIPNGRTTTYGQIALAINQPKAVRAVGTAVGANPLSFVIPCHRVVRQNGDLGGYRWGQALKQKMLKDET